MELTKLQNYIFIVCICPLMHRNMHYILTRTVENLHKINTKILYMHILPIFFTFGILMSKEGLKRKGIMGYKSFPFFLSYISSLSTCLSREVTWGTKDIIEFLDCLCFWESTDWIISTLEASLNRKCALGAVGMPAFSFVDVTCLPCTHFKSCWMPAYHELWVE